MSVLRRPIRPQQPEGNARFEIPDAYLPLLWKEWPEGSGREGSIRYKCYFGGRGAGRSWSFARALIAEAFTEHHIILCTREYQNTIADSVKRVLEQQIRLLGLEPWFLIEKQGIKCRLTGSEFLFKGLRHDVQGIRSLEGVTRVWLEEGQWCTSDSWLILDPTIRNKGSQIWVSYNPVNEDDPTHKMFTVNPPYDAYVCKVGWRDNPWFHETDLERLRLRMLEQDQDAYDWVWEGFTRKVSEATIFRNQYEVHGFDLPEKVDRFFYGVDWGFANDPLAAVRCYITGNEADGQELWIDHEFYSVGIELDDIPIVLAGGVSDRTGARYDGLPDINDWPVKADPSRPETISYVRRKGISISGAETWKGSVDDGIAHLKAFRKIHVHTRCTNTAQEFRLYSWKIDPKTKDQDKPVILPIPVDAFNHAIDACIAEGQLVATARGDIPIEQVIVGDLVHTRAGLHRVYATRCNGLRKVQRLSVGDRALLATEDHRIILAFGGVVRMDALRYADEVICLEGVSQCYVGPGHVLCVEDTGQILNVYDLSVEDQPEFFANGILVHNCRYSLDGYIQHRGGLGVWGRLVK